MQSKKLCKGIALTLLASSNVIWGGYKVYAAETQEFILDEYVVTASRTKEKYLMLMRVSM